MNFTNKTILVTGGTGTFGEVFLKNFLRVYNPDRIRIFSRDEHKQEGLINRYKDKVDGFIGDVRDKERLQRAMEGVDIVLHAAALKRVQSCEYNPFETIKTNVLGSMNVADCALNAGVEKVLAISSDKAVAPLNLYGATKMCMEKLLIHSNSYRGKKKTKISCVRYGNIMGARGSVIPYWQSQIIKKQPITITNPKATRFWFEPQEAIKFVVDSLEMMSVLGGGEIFIPKLPSFNLMDLFHAYAEGSEFTLIGDRVGDKLHETLVLKEEMNHAIEMTDKYVVYPEKPKWEYSKSHAVWCNGRDAYTSDTNKQFLSIEEIKNRLQKVL